MSDQSSLRDAAIEASNILESELSQHGSLTINMFNIMSAVPCRAKHVGRKISLFFLKGIIMKILLLTILISLSSTLFADKDNELSLLNEINSKYLNLANIDYQCKIKSDYFEDKKNEIKKGLKDKDYIDSVQFILEHKNNEFNILVIKGKKNNPIPYFSLDASIDSEKRDIESLFKIIKPLIYAPILEEYLLSGVHKWGNNIFYYYYVYKNEKSINKYIFTKEWILKEVNISSEIDKNKSIICLPTYDKLSGNNLFILKNYIMNRKLENVIMKFNIEYIQYKNTFLPSKIYNKIEQTEYEIEFNYYFYDYTF
jgi:hypothetical protein